MISKQKCKSVIEGVCIHKILSYKNITQSDDQRHKWEASNFYMIMPLRTLLSTHKTFCLKMNYIIWTFIQIYFHILFFYFLNLIFLSTYRRANSLSLMAYFKMHIVLDACYFVLSMMIILNKENKILSNCTEDQRTAN